MDQEWHCGGLLAWSCAAALHSTVGVPTGTTVQRERLPNGDCEDHVYQSRLSTGEVMEVA